VARRYFRVLPPGQFQVEATDMVARLPMDDLRVLEALVQAEVAHRTGREKYRLPQHVLRMLN
jgi:hypothetical protein